MTAHARRTRNLGAIILAVLAATALSACGDGDDGDSDAAAGTGDAAVGADNASFCEGFLGVEEALAEAPEDEAQLPAFVEERIEPNLALIEGNEPDDIADEVQVLTGAVRQVAASGDPSVFETPEFAEASEVVYSALDEACDVDVVEVAAVDYGYEGIPETLAAGPTSFVMTNQSQSGEAHELSLVKLRDDAPALEELLQMPEAEAQEHIAELAGGTFAPPGATAGMVTDLTPGRWAYVCFIPVGSVDGAEGSGPPHFVEGMAGELTVE